MFGAALAQCRGARPDSAPVDLDAHALSEVTKAMWLRWMPHVRFAGRLFTPQLRDVTSSYFDCNDEAKALLSLARRGANCARNVTDSSRAPLNISFAGYAQEPVAGMSCLDAPYPHAAEHVTLDFLNCTCEQVRECAKTRGGLPLTSRWPNGHGVCLRNRRFRVRVPGGTATPWPSG